MLLVTEGTDTDDPSVFGQEAHIISEAAAGPRAAQLPDHDAYDNLILLCSKDHKRVDDQVGHYTTAVLRQIKRDHEEWIASLGEGNGPVRLVADPAHPIPKTFRVCMTASTLWNVMGDAHIFYPSWPDGLSEEQQDLIANFLDDLRDWRDVASMEDSYSVGREASKGLECHIRTLHKAGLLIGARKRHCLLTGGVSQEPSYWRTVDIEIQPLSIAQVTDKTGARIWPPVPVVDRQPDGRTLNFAGDVDEYGQPLPMTANVLRARTEKWSRSPRTPDGVSALLARSRQMFIDGYYTYENFMDAVTRSLQAVEAALRIRFNAGTKATFAALIDRAQADDLVDERTHEILHLGRRFRNNQMHATNLPALNPAMAANMIGTAHKLVAEIFK